MPWAAINRICGVKPDLATFGKAIANGYPLGAIAGKKEIMDLFDAPDPARRVLIAGTYNGHPIPVAAAIATMEKLLREKETLYRRLDALGARLEAGLTKLFQEQRHHGNGRPPVLGLLHLLHGPRPRGLARHRRTSRHEV